MIYTYQSIGLLSSNLFGFEDNLFNQGSLWWQHDVWSYPTYHLCENIFILTKSPEVFWVFLV